MQTALAVNSNDVFADIDEVISSGVFSKHQHTSKGLVPLKRAPNPIIFCESLEFLNLGSNLYPTQFEVLRDFFELLCPSCNDMGRIEQIPRNEQVLYEYNKCPECGLLKFNGKNKLNLHNELAGCAGMRGSKSALAAMIAHWIVHSALCTDDLQSKLNILKNQTIDAAFVAVSSEQAEETVWDHFTSFYSESPWYKDYVSKLKVIEKSPDNNYKVGDLISDTSNKYIHFGDKNLRLKSLHSNSGSLAGKTRLFAVIDELARFDAGESRRSATEVYRVMKHSLATVKAAVNRLRRQGVYDVPDAYMISISSPIFSDDKIMQLVAEAPFHRRMYAFHKTTWEMNPDIEEEDLADEFERDEIGAERDYGANPPGAESPFIKDQSIVDACIEKSKMSMFDLKEEFFERKDNPLSMSFKYVRVNITNMRWKNMINYVVHGDAGESGDSFCLAIGHKEDNITVIDGAIEIRPIPKKNQYGIGAHKVHFPSVTDILLALNNTLSLLAVTYDKWNSTDQIQRLIDKGIVAVSKNLTRANHINFLNGLKNGKIILPAGEKQNINPKVDRLVPCAKANWELKHLNDNGVKVDHPRGGSNDMIQCYIGVHRLLNTPEEVLGKKQVDDVMLKKPIYNIGRKKVGRVVHLRR